ncbi:hypothetical protein IV503_03345 [Klebsiella huaxiensis]
MNIRIIVDFEWQLSAGLDVSRRQHLSVDAHHVAFRPAHYPQEWQHQS